MENYYYNYDYRIGSSDNYVDIYQKHEKMGECESFYNPKENDKYTIINQSDYGYRAPSTVICGIINLGNNCYLNSGLQILASCNELINELNKINNAKGIIIYLKDAIYSLLNKKIYNPENFLNYFCTTNSDFIQGVQCCSQDFIRTLIRNINTDCLSENNNNSVYNNFQYKIQNKEHKEYEKFINQNNLFMESKIQSLFSGITKSYSIGKCCNCLNTIENISFNFFIDVNIYLDSIDNKSDFSDILNSNFGNSSNLSIECKCCGKENTIQSKTSFIKLPDILIFTLERNFEKINNVKIVPNEYIYMDNYLDKNFENNFYIYELFAINIRLGSTINFGHEICQVKRNGNWYEINDTLTTKIDTTSYYDSSYGLFYRKINK